MCFVHLLCILLFFFTREKVGEDLIPFLRQFKPDLLFISAGFDAHHDDMYHFLDEEDFFWLSKELSAVAYHHGIVSEYKLLLMLVFLYFALYILCCRRKGYIYSRGGILPGFANCRPYFSEDAQTACIEGKTQRLSRLPRGR